MPPQGTVAILHQGVVGSELLHWVRRLPADVALLLPRGNQIARQRNLAIHGGPGAWVLFVDSDSVPPPDTLPQLLGHGVDLVGGLVLERFSPFNVCATKSLDPPERWQLADLPRDGLVPVDTVGTGCLLIRRAVCERVAFPWFRCGQITPDLLLEDADLCLRAKDAGIQPYLDCGLRVGHAASAVIWPGRDGRPWVQWYGSVERRVPLDAVAQLDEAGVASP